MKKQNILLSLGLSLTAASLITEKVLEKKDKPLVAYGQKVRVFGKYISTEIIGNGEHVIVLYPGACETSPILSYRPLAKILANYFTVITYEPFGYGDSDLTDYERTVDNLSDELHETMRRLDYNKYSIGMHSAGGIVGMDLANKYPEEVESCLLLDTTIVEIINYTNTLPLEKLSGYSIKLMNALGISRVLSKTGRLLPKVNGYTYTKEEQDQYLKCSIQNAFSRNMQEELDELNHNLKYMQDKKYPDSIPVCIFVSTTTDKMLTKLGAPNNTWIKAHEKLSTHPLSKMFIIDGSHYLHHDYPEDIANDYSEWFKQVI